MLLQGDSFELIKDIKDNSVQLVITSPPFFQQRKYKEETLGQEKDVNSYIYKLITLFKECVRIIKPEGSIVWNLGDKYLSGCLQLIPYKFAIEASNHAKLINNIIWSKSNPTPRQFKRRIVSSHEPFFHFVKTDQYYYKLPEESAEPKSSGMTKSRYFDLVEKSNLTEEQKLKATKDLLKVISEVNDGKVYDFRMKIKDIHSMPFGGQEGGRKSQILNNGYTIIRMYGKKIQKDVFSYPVENIKWCKHPAVYPILIVEKFLGILTKEEDLVLDPFMGSGTTAVACEKMNRQYLGFELCQEFVEGSKKRILDAKDR